MKPCQKKFDWASEVWAPGHSQSISSLMEDIVMKAVTTPPHLPVFTGNTTRLSPDLCGKTSGGAYWLQLQFHSGCSEWRRS